jgi:7,8-dihydropterin-6-yl-methyl-4-(beta-D-ribofuranosyl)aminobenzene 5'-phosphate synthase
MKIITLVENTTGEPCLKPRHGLSLYVETDEHKLLFDVGPNEEYLCNAKKLGVDITAVDTVVISHGHVDHGGGLASFLKINDRARIFLHKQAFGPHYYQVLFAKFYVGLDKKIADSDRFIFNDGTMRIDDQLFLFSDVDGQFDTKSSHAMLQKTPQGYVQDDFQHEQNLIVTQGDKSVLFAGCSHRGIKNIVRAAKKYNSNISAAFGGFHLYNPVTKVSESAAEIRRVGRELSKENIVFYTGHCTGPKALKELRTIMGDNVQSITTGSTIEI